MKEQMICIVVQREKQFPKLVGMPCGVMDKIISCDGYSAYLQGTTDQEKYDTICEFVSKFYENTVPWDNDQFQANHIIRVGW